MKSEKFVKSGYVLLKLFLEVSSTERKSFYSQRRINSCIAPFPAVLRAREVIYITQITRYSVEEHQIIHNVQFLDSESMPE